MSFGQITPTLRQLSLTALMCCLLTNPSVANESKLVFEEQFDGAALDQKNWQIVESNGCPKLCGFGNNELQAYTKDSLSLSDGFLTITASPAQVMDRAYKSAKITTKPTGGWTYGKISVRAKLPTGKGSWPAIWMMPTESRYGGWPASGELDIMEHVGFDQGTIWGTIHTTSYNHVEGTQRSQSITIADAHEQFHVYSLIWRENVLIWQIDGKDFYRIEKEASDTPKEWPFDGAFYLILNLAVGGNWGGEKGVDPNHFPTSMVIDWVKVWQTPS